MNAVTSIPTWLSNQTDMPSSLNMPAWLLTYRKKNWELFLKQGIPTRKNERWKYADLTFLANKNFNPVKSVDVATIDEAIEQHRLQAGSSIFLVMVNGQFIPTVSDTHKLPSGVIACSLSEAWQQHEELVQKYWQSELQFDLYPFACLNAAMFQDGLFFYVPDNCEISLPVHVLSIVTTPDEFIAHPNNMLIFGQQAKVTMLEEYWSSASQAYLMNTMSSITLEKNAVLDYYKLQYEGSQAIHIANTFIQQRQNSSVNLTHFSNGAMFARDDVVVNLLEPGADCHTGGFYKLTQENQYTDFHLDINHAAAHSNSAMLYKGTIAKNARAVFNGRLHVLKDAQKIVAYQANHNLLLSNQAEVYSKPELEIYADDVKCKHGATTGQIDQDALFYMRSRGINRDEAMDILLQGFADEIIQRVTSAGIKMRVQEAMV